MPVLGVTHKSQISRLEAGERGISAVELQRIAEFLGVPLDALIYPELYSAAYRSEDGEAERSSEMKWFRTFRRRYRAFVGTV